MIFRAPQKIYCTDSEKRKTELLSPWNHKPLEAPVTKVSTLAKAKLPETSHSQEYSIEHNQKHSFNFIFFRGLEECSDICITKDKNASIAPKTSVQAQLYHADSRHKSCLMADNMTVCLSNGDQFAGSKNAFLNAVVRNYGLNSVASPCFPLRGN